MTRIAQARGRNPRFPGICLKSETQPATVASLGMQGRLIRGDAEREHGSPIFFTGINMSARDGTG